METKANVGAIALRVINANETEIIKTFKANNDVTDRWKLLSDKLYSEGLRAYMVDKDDKDKSSEAISKLKEYAVLAFTAEQKKLYDADTKTLDELGKFKKKKLQNKRDANVSKVKTHLKKLEDKEDGVTESRTFKAQKSLSEAIGHLEKEEQAHYAISDFIKDIKTLKTKYPGA